MYVFQPFNFLQPSHMDHDRTFGLHHTATRQRRSTPYCYNAVSLHDNARSSGEHPAGIAALTLDISAVQDFQPGVDFDLAYHQEQRRICHILLPRSPWAPM